ncbi:MAG: DUF4412 domain-containing protein [Candidatus Sulfobium sp.]|jgi:outer membrane lipoprotein-sorting protein
MKRFTAFVLFVLLLAGTASALEFSADMVMTARGHKTTGKVYFKGDSFRMDMTSPQKVTTITRLDKKVVWSIMPQQKMYMEIPFNPKREPMVKNKVQGEIERKLIATEKVDGHPAGKYLVTYKSGGKEQHIYQWIATDINFPVKTEAVDGSWSQEYRNISFGNQPDSLFKVPAGYKKFQMPGGMHFPMR